TSAGDHHMLEDRARLDVGQHLIETQIAVLEGDVQLIKHYQRDTLVIQQVAGDRPGFPSLGNIPLAILGIPGESLAHHVVLHLLGKAAEEDLFAGARRPLDELHHPDPEAVAQGAGHHTERRAAFALAVAGVHQQQAVLVLGGGHFFRDDRLLALHARPMTSVALGRLAHCATRRSAERNAVDSATYSTAAKLTYMARVDRRGGKAWRPQWRRGQ